MKKSLFGFSIIFIFSFFFLCYGFSSVQQEEQQEKTFDPSNVKPIAKWIADNAIPVKSFEAGHGFEDLQPLKKILKDVQIVGLGEATHGTREFFQFKHRMLEFLVKEMGFTVFAIEASYPECFNINNYDDTCYSIRSLAGIFTTMTEHWPNVSLFSSSMFSSCSTKAPFQSMKSFSPASSSLMENVPPGV